MVKHTCPLLLRPRFKRSSRLETRGVRPQRGAPWLDFLWHANNTTKCRDHDLLTKGHARPVESDPVVLLFERTT